MTEALVLAQSLSVLVQWLVSTGYSVNLLKIKAKLLRKKQLSALIASGGLVKIEEQINRQKNRERKY